MYDGLSLSLTWDENGEPIFIDAVEGWDQGDPFAPVGFSHGIRTPIRQAREAIARTVTAMTGDVAQGSAVRVWAYLDDLFLLVPPNMVGRALDILFDYVRPTGYETNTSKLEAWCPSGRPAPGHTDARLRNAWRDDGLLVLGGPVGELDAGNFSERVAVPIGAADFRQRICAASLDGARKATLATTELPNLATVTAPAVQAGLQLLRMCIHPRISHILRASYTDVSNNLASTFDALVRGGF